MSVPLIVTPEHQTVVPSGKTVIFRPFLVKEEKLMLTIKENQRTDEVMRVMKQVVSNCVIDDKFDVDKISYNDLEHLFVMMRARSVGESVEFPFSCKECDYEGATEIDITKIQLSRPVPEDDTVMLNESVGVKVKPVGVKGMAHLAKVADTDPLSMLNHVIEYIYNKEQMWKIDDMSQKEITDFVETLSLTQVQKIMGKVEEFPRCCIKDTVTCPSCQKQQEINVEGLENFFT
jgi:hypothetical protein